MTTGIACKELGMKFIGFEIDKIIFEKGRKNWENLLNVQTVNNILI